MNWFIYHETLGHFHNNELVQLIKYIYEISDDYFLWYQIGYVCSMILVLDINKTLCPLHKVSLQEAMALHGNNVVTTGQQHKLYGILVINYSVL